MATHNPRNESLLNQIRRAALQTKEGIKQPIVTDGRRLMLGALEVLAQKETNIQSFYEAAEEEFNADPLNFFKEFIQPFIGKDLYAPQETDPDKDPEVAVRKGLQMLGALWNSVPGTDSPGDGSETVDESDNPGTASKATDTYIPQSANPQTETSIGPKDRKPTSLDLDSDLEI